VDRQPEVQNLHPSALVDHDVARLDVAVEDAGGVGLPETFGHLPHDVGEGRRGEGAAIQHRFEALAADELHRDKGSTIDLVDFVDSSDVRVAEL
jgi:hypothetical protein